jgi:Peptidase family M28
MLDPRIYRTGFIAVVLAAIVFAFSLRDQHGPLSSTLTPDAFNGAGAVATMHSLSAGYPDRRPGSTGDLSLAAYVKSRLSSIQGKALNVSQSLSTARTVDGKRTLETVTAVRPGLEPGSIVVVAHRDSLSTPSEADLSGTAALLELARVLAGETPHHSIVFESISGSTGLAGATNLARSLTGQPVDAVIALGDLAGAHVTGPIVVPWSTGQNVAPPLLRTTVEAAVRTQSSLRPGGTSLGGQLAHLAFPLTISEQGPFDARGLPSVLVSLSGDHVPAADAQVDGGHLTGMGQAVLQAVNSLDAGSSVGAPAPYVLIQGKVLPAWAVRLLVLALILPVLAATVDGLARARRRGHSITRWTLWVLASAVPFLLALVVFIVARLLGAIANAPPGAVAANAVPLHGAGVTVLLLGLLAIVLGFVFVRPLIIAASGGRRGLEGSAPEGAGVALLLVMCVVALAVWVVNPFAALLIVPALHLWMWVADADVRLRPVVSAVLLLIGLAPPILVVAYYAHALSLGPVGLLWNGLLLLLGGQLTIATAVEWSVLLGCVASVILLVVHAAREPTPEQLPITVRGPIGYAGPGSLGGTESAIRR